MHGMGVAWGLNLRNLKVELRLETLLMFCFFAIWKRLHVYVLLHDGKPRNLYARSVVKSKRGCRLVQQEIKSE